jgi:alpha-galactosidase
VRWGESDDPSRAEGSIGLLRSWHHADQTIAPDGALRSESLAVLADAGPTRLLVAFESGREHDGTIWLRPGRSGVELVAQAYLGGAELAAGERRDLHGLVSAFGPDPSLLLEAWATYVGARERARTSAPYQLGWCSWYHYFHAVTEEALRANLDRAGDWPFEVFQLDDGYQPAIGDWLRTNERFPSDPERLAADIGDAGMTPGLWLAPFIASPDSEVATTNPGWIASHESGRPLVANVVPEWGGAVLALDTTRPEVLAHLEGVASALVQMGFTYLKLDFTYAPAIDGGYADRSQTPAQRVRAGYDAVRRGAGDDAFLLGCGAPLGCTVGVVDGMRIGPDVAPAWRPETTVAGYDDTVPATRNAWRNTLVRSYMHRKLWLNDPDCLMLRSDETRMSARAIEAWARAVGVSGGMALVSDDLALLGDDARHLLDNVLTQGREADAEAVAGNPARCSDLMTAAVPGLLSTSTLDLVADPSEPTSTLRRRLAVSGAQEPFDGA